MGKDPLRIEHHWQFMYRSSHFRGSAIEMGADQRDRHRALGYSRQALRRPRASIARRQGQGQGACLLPRVRKHPREARQRRQGRKGIGFHCRGAPDAVPGRDRTTCRTSRPTWRRSRTPSTPWPTTAEAVGRDVDLCIEIHRRLTPTEAVQLGLGIEKFHPYFSQSKTP